MNSFPTLSSLPMTAQLPADYVSVSTSVGIILFLLLVFLGFSTILCYVTRQYYRKKLKLLTTTPMARSVVAHSTHVYNEVSPIYEALSITVVDKGQEVTNLNEQELFTHRASTIQTNTSTSGCIAEGIDMVDNEAYNRSLLNDSITKAIASDNNSYTSVSAEHDYDICTSTELCEEGLFESLYDDTVIYQN